MIGSKGKHAYGIGLEENAAAFGQLDVTVTNNQSQMRDQHYMMGGNDKKACSPKIGIDDLGTE